MNDSVFILGAGASKDSGAPLMNEFIDVAEDLYFEKKFSHDQGKISRIFELIGELQKVHSKSYLDLTNIETLFGSIEMARVIKQLGIYNEEDIKEFRVSMVTLIVKTLEHSMKFELDHGIPLPSKSYGEFAKLITTKKSLKPSAILTFNYDIALDYALARIWNTVSYNLMPDETGEPTLLKLHGSINWGRDKKTGLIVPYTIEKMLKDWTFHPLGGEPAILEFSKFLTKLPHHFKGMEFEDSPVLVPPNWNKSEYHGSLTNVWAAAAKALSNARNIYVFGYSLPESDSFFRYLFALGTMGNARIRRFWVFDPDPTGNVKKRFELLLGKEIESRFQFFPMHFANALNHLNSRQDIS